MITPVLLLDSHETWRPMAVESIVAAGAKQAGEPVVDVDALDGDVRIDFPGGMRQPPVDQCVGYHRVVRGGGLHWHQFWTWWLYNPKKYAGFGEHEGDWEMCQLGCVDEAGDHPVLMTCSQHDGGEKREFWRVDLDEGTEPKVFVARDSHANYFAAHHDVTDQADGKLLMVGTDWRPFGPWAEFKGKWGNSENSPGPLTTRRAWQAPHAWHGQARG